MKFAPRIPLLLLLALVPAGANEVDGLTQPFKLVRVSSPVQEIITEIAIKEGDTVKTGDLLARLFDEREQSEFRRAEEVLRKREFDFKSTSSLATDRITSRERVLTAEIELALAKEDLALAKSKLDERSIQSPLDGIVIRRFKEAGESVDRIEPLFEVVDISRLYLQFYVPAPMATSIDHGEPVTFWAKDAPEQTMQANVEFVSPAADAASGLFRVRLLYDNNPEAALPAGIRVTAKFPGN